MSNQQFEWQGVVLHAIPGHPGYAASEDGRIWSAWRFTGRPQLKQMIRKDAWKELKPDIRRIDGRRRFTLKAADGTYRRKYASHFILETFVGPRPDGMEACHNNGDCTNDSRDNLRWDTSKNNKADMAAHGTRPSGERHPNAKLTDRDVTVVLQRRREGETPSQIARQFGVTVQRVQQICKKGRR
ncbi:MAG: sigma factor-like helix-turn-helix DNA-binding protein [Planctomycetaceae bacterium]